MQPTEEDGSPSGWVRLELIVRPELKDAVVLALTEAGVPGWEEPSPDGIRLWALEEDAGQLATKMGAIPGVVSTALEPQADRSGWHSGWSPERVGRFVVANLGAPDPEVSDDQLLVRIAPAMAFGGGEHPTTRQCLRALPDRVWPGARGLDVGCGSGVLSVAAAQLGARMEAVDVDPIALAATARAAEANGVRIDVLGETLDRAVGPYDFILANILAPTLIALAPALVARLSPAGHLLLAGIRTPAKDEVLAAYQPLRPTEVSEEEGWSLLRLSA